MPVALCRLVKWRALAVALFALLGLTLSVSAIAAPSISPASFTALGAVVGSPYSQTFAASGGTAPYTFAVTSGSLPAGLSLNAATGVLSGTPSAAETRNFIVQATDASLATVSGNYILTVATPTPTLTFATSGSASVALGHTLSNSASSSLSGGGYGAITYSSNSGVAMVNANTGVVTPVSAGTATITATQAASAANAQASASYTLTVLALPVGTLTFSTPTNASVSLGGSLTNQASSTLSGGIYGAISYLSANPSIATVDANGVVTPVSQGIVLITATQAASAANAAASENYTLTVTAASLTANPVSVVVAYGSRNNPIALNISGAATSVALASAPSHGTATVSGLSISYSPAAGYSGSDSFTYTAADAGGASAPATVSILVALRADPGQDAEVKGLLRAQADSAKRFADAQIINFQTRLEALHSRSKALWRDEQKLSSRTATGAPNAVSATGGDDFGASVTAARNVGRTAAGRSVRAGNALCPVSDSEACSTAGVGGLSSGDLSNAAQASAAGSQGLTSLWPGQTLNLAGQASDPFGYAMEVWSAGTINVGRQSQDDTRFNTAGISLGGDSRVGENLIVGVGAGFGHERQKIGDNGTRQRVDGYSLAVYGSYQPAEGFFVDGLAGYGQLDFDAQRYVTSTGDLAQSQRKGGQWFSSLAGGYEYVEGKSLLSPYGRIDLSSVRLDESTESGGGIYDLVYSEQTTQSRKLALGLRGETLVLIDSGLIKPNFRIEYQHEFAKQDVANIRYADQLFGTAYQLETESIDRNSVSLGVGCDFELRQGWGGALSYRFAHSTSSASQSSVFGAQLRRSF